MVKLKITRADGVVIECEGNADDLAKLIALILPWPAVQLWTPQVSNPLIFPGSPTFGTAGQSG